MKIHVTVNHMSKNIGGWNYNLGKLQGKLVLRVHALQRGAMKKLASNATI